MKLLMVVGTFPQRSETFIYRKAVALARRGHDVTVATRAPGEWSLYPDPLPRGLRVEVLPPDGALRDPRRAWAAVSGASRFAAGSVGKLRRLFDRCRVDPRTRLHAATHLLRHLPLLARDVDVVHFEFLGLGAMYPLARELMKVPVVVSCRGSDTHLIAQRSLAEQAPSLATLRDADAVHCVSDEMVGEVTRLSGRTAGLWVNRPAVDVDQIAARPARTTPGPLRIVATGRLIWTKGFDYLLTALSLLRQRGVDVRAEIIGDGELKKSLGFSIGDLGLADRVTLVGALSSTDAIARMQRADLFVLSSHHEGISNAALEAMASGLPVVTTDVGGMPEAVTDGVEGFVVPARDIAALADRIGQIAGDDALRIRLGVAARARAVREFSLARQVATFEKIYGSVRAGFAR